MPPFKDTSLFLKSEEESITAHHCRKLCASQPHHERIAAHHCQKTTHPTHPRAWLELPCSHCWRGGRPKLCQERPLQELARGSAGAGVGSSWARSGHCRSWRGGRLLDPPFCCLAGSRGCLLRCQAAFPPWPVNPAGWSPPIRQGGAHISTHISTPHFNSNPELKSVEM